MKVVKKRLALIMFIILSLILALSVGSHRARAQGSGQGGQPLSLGGLGGIGLGAGAMVGAANPIMLGTWLGQIGMGASIIPNSLGMGLSLGGIGSLMTAATGSVMMGGALIPGSLGGSMGIQSPSLGSMGANVNPLMLSMMGQNLWLPSAAPISSFMPNLYNNWFPFSYGMSYSAYGIPLSNVIRNAAMNPTSTYIPLFINPSGIWVPPFPEIYGFQLGMGYIPFSPGTLGASGASILPSNVIGHVYEKDSSLPIEGVKVSLLYHPENYVFTDPNGYYQFISLFSGNYTFIFSKHPEYQDTDRKIQLPGATTKILDVFMESALPKMPPQFREMPSMEFIAGDKIILNPEDYASDPDGDILDFHYSGFMNTNQYVTTEDDIGDHTVTITARDSDGDEATQEVKITVCPGYEMNLYAGFNLISFPFENGDPNLSAFDLLEKLGDADQIDSILSYSNPNDDYLTAWYDSNGIPQGDDFLIEIGKGYIVYANVDLVKRFKKPSDQNGHYLQLFEGMNLIGVASIPEGYMSYDLLSYIGHDYVECIYRYNSYWGEWESSYWLNGTPVGDEFPIRSGEGYHIQMKIPRSDLLIRKDLMLTLLRFFVF